MNRSLPTSHFSLLTSHCLLLTAIFLALTNSAHAQEAGTAAAPFLLQNQGTVSAGMGDAGTGGPADQDAAYFNPAAIAWTERQTLSLQHLEHFSGDNFEYITYSRPFGKRWGFGITGEFVYFVDSVRNEFNSDEEFTNYDLMLGLSAAYQLNSRLAIGGTAKWIKERVFRFQDQTTAFDFAALYRTPFKGLTIGFTKKDLGEGLQLRDTKAPLPSSDRWGLAYQYPGSPWRFVADVTHVSEQKLRLNYGLSRQVGEYLNLRGGYRFNYDGLEADGFTAGLGIKYDNIAFDYAYVPSDNPIGLGASHRIQTVLNFGAIRAPDTEATPWIRRPAMPTLAAAGPVTQSQRFRGTISVGGKGIDIDNDQVIGYVPGFTPAADIYLAGMIGNADATIAASGYWDQWDNMTLDRGALNLTARDLRVTAGDFVANLSPLSVAGRQMRGGEAAYTLEREPAPVPAPSGEALRSKEPGGVNLGRHLRKNGFGKQSFSTTTFRGFGGRTEAPLNVGKDIPRLNGLKATYGVFEQFTYGAELTTELQHNFFITMRAAHVADDPFSLYDPGVTDPLKNTVLTAAARKLFGSGKLSAGGELAYSIYDLDAFSQATEVKHDIAYIGRVNFQKEKWKMTGEYESIGSKFDLGGNTSMRSLKDRKGPRLRMSSEINDWLTLRSRLHYYRDNLDQDREMTIKTFDGGIDADISLPSEWKASIGYASRMDWSNLIADSSVALSRVNTRNDIVSGRVSGKLWKWSFGANSSTSLTRNRNVYAPGIAVGGNKIMNLGLNLSGPITLKSDFLTSYNRTELTFAIPSSKTIYQQVFGKVNYRGLFSNRLDIFASGRLNINKGASQLETRTEYSLGGRAMVFTGHSLSLEYKRITDHFEPYDPLLDFNSYVVDARYTRVF